MNLHDLLLELTAVLAFWLMLGASQQDRDQPGRTCFAAMCVSVVIWCVGELLELRGAVDAWTGTRIKFLGIMTLPALWLGVAAHAGRLQVAQRLPWFPAALLVPELAIYSVLFMGPWSALFLSPHGNGHGPLWAVHCVYGYALVGIATAIYLTTALRPGRPGRKWRLAIGTASLLPIAGNAAYLANWFDFAYDPTPVLVGATLVLLRRAVFPGGLLDALPIAQRDLIDHLPLGVVLADRHGVVIDVNGAAVRGLALSRREALGRTLDAVLGHAPRGTRIETSSVELRGREEARFALLEFPTAGWAIERVRAA